MAIEPVHYRFTARDYHRMHEVGILAEDDRVELIDGEIVQLTVAGGRHVACVNRLNRLLMRAARDDAVGGVDVRGGAPATRETDLLHPMHVVEAALVGAHVGTMPFKVLEMMFHHPLTDAGLEKFAKDWEKANLKDLEKAMG